MVKISLPCKPRKQKTKSAVGQAAKDESRKRRANLTTTIDRTGKARKPFKEMSWQKAQTAPVAAAKILKNAPDPFLLAGHKGLRKLLNDAKQIAGMSLGKHGEQRTPVPKLREAIGRLETNSCSLPVEGREFIKSVTDGMVNHLGCVNTDKSFKPFAVVLVAVLELAKMTEDVRA